MSVYDDLLLLSEDEIHKIQELDFPHHPEDPFSLPPLQQAEELVRKRIVEAERIESAEEIEEWIQQAQSLQATARALAKAQRELGEEIRQRGFTEEYGFQDWLSISVSRDYPRYLPANAYERARKVLRKLVEGYEELEKQATKELHQPTHIILEIGGQFSNMEYSVESFIKCGKTSDQLEILEILKSTGFYSYSKPGEPIHILTCKHRELLKEQVENYLERHP